MATSGLQVAPPIRHKPDRIAPKDLVPGHNGLGPGEMAVVLIAIPAWVLLFAAALIVGTAPYLKSMALPEQLSPRKFCMDSMIVFICWTPTNIHMLCCLAALLGAVSRRTRLYGTALASQLGDKKDEYFGAILQGFFVYLSTAAGAFLVGQLKGDLIWSPKPDTSPTQYLKLAATASLFSFIAGSSPRLLDKLRASIPGLLESSADSGGGRGKARDRGTEPDVRDGLPLDRAVVNGKYVRARSNHREEPASDEPSRE